MVENKKFRHKVKVWTQFYRENPHIWARDFLNIDLTLYQALALNQMVHYENSTLITARGLGKTYIVAIYTLFMAIMYPESKITISSGTLNQAFLTLEKIIDEIYPNAPLLHRELNKSEMTLNDATKWTFNNGSVIRAVTSSNTARGVRSNVLIMDEFRMIEKDIYTDVLQPTLAASRQPGYLRNSKYKDLKNSEPNRIVQLSSAWYKYHWSWNEYQKNAKLFTKEGRKGGILSIPYQFAVADGIVSIDQYQRARESRGGDMSGWTTEYEAIFYSQTQGSAFDRKDLDDLRTVVQARYPRNVILSTDIAEIDVEPRKQEEFNVVCCDPAFAGGKNGDYTSFTIVNVRPSGNRYIRRVIYQFAREGGHHVDTSNTIKKLYYDFDCSYIVLDINNMGRAIYLELAQTSNDKPWMELGFAAMNRDNLRRDSLAINPNCVENVFAVFADNNFKREALTALMNVVATKKIEFLIEDIEAERYYMTIDGFSDMSTEQQAELLKPYYETRALIDEISNIQTKGEGSSLKVVSKSRRDDRYTSLSYGNLFITQKEQEYIAQKEREKRGDSNFIMLVG